MRTLITLSSAALAGALLLTAAAPSTTMEALASGLETSPTEAIVYNVDLGHSNIIFKCKHLGVS